MRTRHVLSALAIVAISASLVTAQPPTDVGSTGTGAGVGGSVAPLGTPGRLGSVGGRSRVTTNRDYARGQALLASFRNVGAAGMVVPNPMGGEVTLPQGLALALGGVFSNNPSAEQIATVEAALEGIPGPQRANLMKYVLQTGKEGYDKNTGVNLAVAAYNAAVDALPANVPVPQALLGIRHAISIAF